MTFALFLYEEPQTAATLLSNDKIGFSSGNSNQTTELETVEEINIFRIDGRMRSLCLTLKCVCHRS